MDVKEQQEEERAAGVAAAWVLGFGVGVIVLGILGVAYLIGYNNGEGEGNGEPAAARAPVEKPRSEAPPAPVGPGQELFVQSCGGCHTLAEAETSGSVGPNLDDLQPDDAQVSAAIEHGGAGSGAMPAGLLEGSDAEAVAAYVAEAAGK